MTETAVKNNTKVMTEGSPIRLILLFSIPLMVGNVFQQLYTLVDTLVVGRGLGVTALAGVGNADWLNWLVLGTVTGFSQGFSIPMAQHFGAGDHKALRKTVGSAAVLCGCIALATVAIFQSLSPVILKLMHTPPEILPLSLSYLRVVFAGIPLVLAYNLFASILRALGDGKTPLYAMIAAALINVGLDILFVLVFHWGIPGAAFATILAQGCSGLYCLNVLRRLPVLKMEKSDFFLKKDTAVSLLKLGAPMAFQNLIIAIGGMILQGVINGFGVLFIAGYTATNKMYGILEMAAVSFGYAMTTYAGQNLGAKKIDRISKGMRSAIGVSLVVSVTIGTVMILVGKPLLSLFLSGDPADVAVSLRVAYTYMVTMNIFLPILYILHVVRSALQGMGDTVRPMISGFVEFFMRTGFALIMPAFIGEMGIYLAEMAAWTGADLVLIPAYIVLMNRLKKKGFA